MLKQAQSIMMTLNKMIVGGFIGIALTSLQAWAIPISVGQTVTPNSAALPGGLTLLANQTTTYTTSAGAVKIAVDAAVYSGNSLGGYTFTYQIRNIGTTKNLTQFSVDGWDPFFNNPADVNVSYQTSSGLRNPTGAIRADSTESDDITFNFSTLATRIAPGQQSALLIFESSINRYDYWGSGGGTFSDNKGFIFDIQDGTPLLGPPLPDGGTTIILFGFALTGLGLLRRKLA